MTERKDTRITPFSAGDCAKEIPNQFNLVIIAAKRMRELVKGAKPLVPANGDHNMTIALREIAAGLVGNEYLTKEEPKAQNEKTARPNRRR